MIAVVWGPKSCLNCENHVSSVLLSHYCCWQDEEILGDLEAEAYDCEGYAP